MNRWLCSLLLLGLFPVAASAQTVSVVPSATTYVATGGTASFTVTLTYPGVVTALGFQFGSVPAGWSFVSAGGNNPPGIVPAVGTAGAFEFAYTSTPARPITFTITAAYPAGLVGNQIFSGVIGTLRPGPVSVNGANVVLSPSTAVGAPAITRQPVGAVLTQGDNYLLTVEASGAAPLTYQWRKDAVPVSGATTASLALNAAKAADQGAYSVVVTNAQSSATSAAAAISVVPAAIAPTFSRAPSAQSATAGTDVTFSVVVAGTAPFTYQWLRGGQALAGEIGATLTLRSVQKTNEGAYSVAVSNAGGTASSPAAALTIIGGVTAPTITTQPVAQSAALGGSATFSVVAAGAAPLAYQWTFNGVAITGATGATLPVPTVQSSLFGSYAVVGSNAAGGPDRRRRRGGVFGGGRHWHGPSHVSRETRWASDRRGIECHTHLGQYPERGCRHLYGRREQCGRCGDLRRCRAHRLSCAGGSGLAPLQSFSPQPRWCGRSDPHRGLCGGWNGREIDPAAWSRPGPRPVRDSECLG